MRVWHCLEPLPYDDKQLVLALGNFDGMHRGHQDLLRKMVSFARQEGKVPAVFLFHPHPQNFLHPDNGPKLLLDLDKKLELLAGLGIEAVFVIPFDSQMAALDAGDFVSTILVKKLRAASVFVGFNYRFGRRALGTPEQLVSLGKQHGFSVTVIPPVFIAGTLVSSTSIRAALDTGDIDQARQLLGYWPTIRGIVVQGDRRGRQIGFPTANVATAGPLLVPCAAVYAGSARIAGSCYTTVLNIGFRPTFVDSQERVIEAHLLNFQGSAYGEDIEIEIYRRLRWEQRFDSAEALVLQINKDIEEAVAVSAWAGVRC
ncbi:MAG: bifunctional riboflavin kinase/FAD synthetase [Thermacetogeniaceae bacterium]